MNFQNQAYLKLSRYIDQCILANVEHQRDNEDVYEFAIRVQQSGIYPCKIGRSCGNTGYQVSVEITGPDTFKYWTLKNDRTNIRHSR